MLLGFKRRFAPFVEDGSKTHTIRAISKRRPFRVGDRCDCYVDSRQKTMRLLGRFECIKVQFIRIEQTHWQGCPLRVRIDGIVLAHDEADTLFERDGFRDKTGETFQHMQQAASFWKDRPFPFDGQLIHWKYAAPEAKP